MKPCSFEIRAFKLHSSLYCMLDFFIQSTQFQIFFRLDTRENRIRIVLLLHRQCNNKALLWLWHTWSLPDTMMSIYWGVSLNVWKEKFSVINHILSGDVSSWDWVPKEKFLYCLWPWDPACCGGPENWRWKGIMNDMTDLGRCDPCDSLLMWIWRHEELITPLMQSHPDKNSQCCHTD